MHAEMKNFAITSTLLESQSHVKHSADRVWHVQTGEGQQKLDFVELAHVCVVHAQTSPLLRTA